MKARLISGALTTLLLVGALIAYRALTPETDTYTLTADVRQAPNLFEDGRVMVRGVEVGDIVEVMPHDDGVRLTMEIDAAVKIPAGASLAVVPITVISDRYVQLFPAYTDGPALAQGGHIPMARTTIPAELDDVLEQLDGLLAALEPRAGQAHGPLSRLVRSLEFATRGRSESLAGALEGSATVLENLALSETNITGLIRNLDGLFLALANRSSEIGIVNERFALVAESLLSDQDNLEGTIENLSLLADEAANLFDESGESLGASFSRLATVLGTVLKHQDRLTEGIRWANVISQGLGATDAQGRGLNAYSGRQAAPGTPGAEYNYRLDSRDTIACERIEVTTEVLLAILPNATIDDVMDTLLSYIPEEYDDDLAFLLRQLIPLCTSLSELPPVTPEVEAKVALLVDQVGEARLKELLVRWVAEGLSGDDR